MKNAVWNVHGLLAELEAVELVRRRDEPEPGYMFKHALVQDTAYATLLKGDRKLFHHAVATSLVEHYPDRLDENAAQLAEHYWRAEDWAKAAEFSQRAGTNALRVFAMREATGHFERARLALQNLPHAEPRASIDAILGWSQAAYRLRPFAEQLEQLRVAEEMARGLDDKRRLAQILHRQGSAHMASGHNLIAAPFFAECFTLADELSAQELTVLPTYFMGTVKMDADPRTALELLEEAVELAQRYPNADVLASALGTQAMLYARLGEAERAQAKLNAAFDALEDVQSPMTESDVILYGAWSWLEMGDVPRGLELGRRGVEKALASENMDCLCYGFTCLGFAHMYSENPEQARAAFQEALRRSHFSGAAQVENLAASGLAMSKIFGGEADAMPELENAYHEATRLGSPFAAALVAQTLGELYIQQGNLPRAVEYLDSAYEYFARTELHPHLERTRAAQAQVALKQTA